MVKVLSSSHGSIGANLCSSDIALQSQHPNTFCRDQPLFFKKG